MAFRIVFQKLNSCNGDGRGVLEGNQRSAFTAEEFDGVPVGCGDDGFAGAHGKGKGSRYSLFLVAIGRDVNVGRTDQRSHFLGAEEPVQEYYLALDSQFPGQGLQLIPVPVALAGSDMRMSGACDQVNNILMAGEDARQGPDRVLESLV